MSPIHTKTYIFTLVATIAIFGVALFGSTYFARQRTEQIRAEESKIAIDILSLETRYELLKEASCKEFKETNLRGELDELASKLEFMEGQVGKDDAEVFRLQRYHSILQIKYYLLIKNMSEQCNLNRVSILYFYSRKNCTECKRQELLLKAARNDNSAIDIYSFDYELDLSAVQTLITLHNIPSSAPAIDINGRIYAPFESLEDLKIIIANQATSSTRKANR